MIMSGTTNVNEWQRVATNDSEWQQMTISDSEWQQVAKLMKTVQYTSKNGWLSFFMWLCQGTDGCN